MRKLKNSKGITLIALVVTIVVLLILAAISVNLTLGDNGIFSKASIAKDEYEVAQIKEEAEQVKAGLKIDELTKPSQGILKKSKLLLALQNHFAGSTLENEKVVVRDGNYDVAVVGDNLEIVVTKHNELKKGEIEIVYDYDEENIDDVLTILVSANIGGYESYQQYVQEILNKLPSVETEEGMKAREELFIEGFLYIAEQEEFEELESMKSAQTFSEFVYYVSEGELENINDLNDLLDVYGGGYIKSIDELLIGLGCIDTKGYEENSINGEIEIILPNGNSEHILSGAYISYDVYENGTYTFKAIGTNGKTTTKKIEIQVSASSIQLNEQAIMGVGDTKTLDVTLVPSLVKNTKITWTSSNKSVAKVNNGIITGISAGNTIITAEMENGKKATCNLEVVNEELSGLEKLIGSPALAQTQTVNDEFGNQVVIPKNFKLAQDSGTTVQQGVVIQDKQKNQYVWVPVSNIDASGSNKIVLDNGNQVEITLGRYTFDVVYKNPTTTTSETIEGIGEATLQQKGSEWAEEKAFPIQVNATATATELKNFRESNEKEGLDGTNTTAKDLAGFIESVRDNHGYYIARYEASKEKETSTERFASIKNKTAWTMILQGNAAKVCKNMYTETDDDLECDLMNSYAWDTAIVYIQKCTGEIEYSKANGNNNRSLAKTGMTGDEKCKINDMAKNINEWTTEYFKGTVIGRETVICCTSRGGRYRYMNYFAAERDGWSANSYGVSGEVGFRPIIYIAP